MVICTLPANTTDIMVPMPNKMDAILIPPETKDSTSGDI